MDRLCDILRSVRIHVLIQPFWPFLMAFQAGWFERGGGHAILNIALGPVGISVTALDEVTSLRVTRERIEAAKAAGISLDHPSPRR